MSIPWDVDLPIFVWAMAKVVFARKKRARDAQRGIPVHPEYEEVPESALTQAQRDYIRPFDEQLGALNYRVDCTFHTTNMRNYGQNLVRRYVNPSDSAVCALTIVELKAKVDKVEAVKTSSHVGFTTRFSDGTLLTTRNMALKSLMDHPPYRVVQECRQVTDLAELKRRHDARAAQMGVALPPVSGTKTIFEEQRKEHQRFSEFQVQRGIYQLLPGGEFYEATDKARARGVWNHFNPFAKRVSWGEQLLSALVGSVLPLLAILKIGPLIVKQFGDSAIPAASLLNLVAVLTSYILAGLIIGSITEWAPFFWIMVISYVPAHFMAGWSFGWFPYSTTMFVIAFQVIQARRRREMIFESQQERG